MINIQDYKANSKLTREQLIENNFRYIDGCYSYRFPVAKYKKEVTLWGIFIINLDSKNCDITVVNSSFNTYPAFHNRIYGSANSQLIMDIDDKIQAQLNQFLKNKIIFKRRNKRRSK